MTLDEKIGQMTQVDKNAATLKDGHEINQFFLGSVLSGARLAPQAQRPGHLGRR